MLTRYSHAYAWYSPLRTFILRSEPRLRHCAYEPNTNPLAHRAFSTAFQHLALDDKSTKQMIRGTVVVGGPLYYIRRSIQFHGHKKWGLLLYRCDYASDELWHKFLEVVQSSVERDLRSYTGDDVRGTLEMTPKEDKATLDGATVDQVRDIFAAWLRSDEAKAETSDSD
jgi:hypothetical protein